MGVKFTDADFARIYTINDSSEFNFIQLPKALFFNEKYADLSSNAKIVYGFYRDKYNLSNRNNWHDLKNRVFFIFSQKDIATILHTSESTIKRAVKELREHKLIYSERLSTNHACRIYLCKPEEPIKQIDEDAILLAGAKGQEAQCKNGTNRSRVGCNYDTQSTRVGCINDPVIRTKDFNNNYNKSNNNPPIPPKQNLSEKRFDEFWKAYPKKVGKGGAKKKFIKLNPNQELFDKIIDAVTRAKQTRQWNKENGQYIPNPETWINQERWEDELDNRPNNKLSSSRIDMAQRAIDAIMNGE